MDGFPAIGHWMRKAAAALALLGLTLPAQATSYSFTGGAQPGCTLSGSTYTCASLNLSVYNDTIDINNGYTVNVGSSLTLGYNQTLSMNGSARLSVTGNLDLSNVANANMQVQGGTLVATGTFSAGAVQQTIKADIIAGSMNIGTGSNLTIHGSLTSSGPVTIASNTTIKGDISGTTITTNSGVTLHGDVSATTSFVLASNSSLKGDITAPKVSVLASNATVQGSITASTSVTIGSGNLVKGDITTSELELQASNAQVKGAVTADHVTLGWAGQITDQITCRSGNTAGNCDCVTNNSGYAVNSSNGPSCPAASSGSPDHIRIYHSGTGLTCAPSTVTVQACANSTCSSYYTGGYSVTLSPGGGTVTIGSSGINNSATIAYTGNLSETISVSPAGTNATQCYNTGNSNAASCAFTFAKSGFQVTALDASGATITATTAENKTTDKLRIQSVTQDAGSTACVPGFANVTKSVKLTCSYTSPATVKKSVRLAGTALNGTTNPDASCDTTGSTQSLNFDSGGKTDLDLKYAEAGKVSITAEHAALNMKGTATITFFPASLNFTKLPTMPIAAGVPFQTTVTALNGDNATTANYTTTAATEAATLGFSLCTPSSGAAPALSAAPVSFTNGVANFTATWSEVGSVDLTAKTVAYQGIARTISGTTGTCGVRFRPDHFDVEHDTGAASASAKRSYYYSGQTIPLRIIARNAANAVTTNYKDTTAKDVTLAFYAKDTNAANPGPGTVSNPTVKQDKFVAGQADVTTPVYTFTPSGSVTYPIKPWKVWVGATDGEASYTATDTPEYFWIRTGRVRMSNFFVTAVTQLSLPIALQYWTGNSWMINTDDNYTDLPSSAFAKVVGGTLTGISVTQNVKMSAGQGKAIIQRTSGRGSVDLALNLGANASDLSCLSDARSSTGANLAYLRSLYGSCHSSSSLGDPSARATFGVYTPETKRIIHMREVFN